MGIFGGGVHHALQLKRLAKDIVEGEARRQVRQRLQVQGRKGEPLPNW